VHRQVFAGELGHRAHDHRLGERHQRLTGERPRERQAAQAQEPAGGDERAPERQRGAEPAVQQRARGDRERDVEQREDLREPADRVD
jgi:hypothetical protein